ncbi:hypothetical protein [Moorena producens]
MEVSTGHPITCAHEVHGLIRDKWADLGWEKSSFGTSVDCQ